MTAWTGRRRLRGRRWRRQKEQKVERANYCNEEDASTRHLDPGPQLTVLPARTLRVTKTKAPPTLSSRSRTPGAPDKRY